MRQTLPEMEWWRRSGRQTAFRDIELVDLDTKSGCLEFLIKAGLDGIPVVAPLIMMKAEPSTPYFEGGQFDSAMHGKANARKNIANKRKIGAAYRISVLRTCCAYRTIFNEEACVIAGMVPIEILEKEKQRLYDRAYLTGESPVRRRQFARTETVAEWQKK